MSAPEPDQPQNPAEPRPPPLMGAVFWVLMMFAVLCVLAGVVVAVLGPRLLPHKPQAAMSLAPDARLLPPR